MEHLLRHNFRYFIQIFVLFLCSLGTNKGRITARNGISIIKMYGKFDYLFL